MIELVPLGLVALVLAGGVTGFFSGVAAGDTATCAGGFEVVVGAGVVAGVGVAAGADVAATEAVAVAVAVAVGAGVVVAPVAVAGGVAAAVAVAVAAGAVGAAEAVVDAAGAGGVSSPPSASLRPIPAAMRRNTPAAIFMTVLPDGPDTGMSTGSLAAARLSAEAPLAEADTRDELPDASPADPAAADAPSSIRRRLSALRFDAASGSSDFGAAFTEITGAAAMGAPSSIAAGVASGAGGAGGAETTSTTGAATTGGETVTADSTVVATGALAAGAAAAAGAEASAGAGAAPGASAAGAVSAGGAAGTTTGAFATATSTAGAADTGPAAAPVPSCVFAAPAGLGMALFAALGAAATGAEDAFASAATGGSGSTSVSDGAAAGEPATLLGIVSTGGGVSRLPSASVADPFRLVGPPGLPAGSSSTSQEGRIRAACRSASSGERGFPRSAAAIFVRAT